MRLIIFWRTPSSIVGCLYLSPNDKHSSQLLNSIIFLTQSPGVVGNFNKYQLNYYSPTRSEGLAAETFALAGICHSLVTSQHMSRIMSINFAYTLDLFLTTKPENFSVSSLSPLGSSVKSLIIASLYQVVYARFRQQEKDIFLESD